MRIGIDPNSTLRPFGQLMVVSKAEPRAQGLRGWDRKEEDASEVYISYPKRL